MHLPAYIEDAEIEMNLRSMKVEILSPIKRRLYPGTTMADGTRYAKVILPDTMISSLHNQIPNRILYMYS